ncbi:class I SAM-dependent methyltransferase [Campylobacter upsaliensis]|nr:class I SAM-dependent methyltransferase [Campylobacter upsaliensis]
MKFLPHYDEKIFLQRVEIYKNLLKKFNQIHNLTQLKNIECELKNLHIIKEKVQNHKAEFKADFITSRALMKAKDLIQICRFLSDENTTFILYKGSEAKKEMQDFKDYQIYENKWRKYCVFNSTNSTHET